jgi:serine/threonine protein kinase
MQAHDVRPAGSQDRSDPDKQPIQTVAWSGPRAADVTTPLPTATGQSLIESDDAETVLKPPLGELAVPKVFAERYEIVCELARGGMGIVYVAEDRRLNRRVALKTQRVDCPGSGDYLIRFHREAYAAAQLNHPHIVPIFDFGHEQGVSYYTMALVDGEPLTKFRHEFSREPRAAVELLLKVAQAVGYAHNQGIVHRDLKPSNILVDRAGEPRIVDFGLVKFVPQTAGTAATEGRPTSGSGPSNGTDVGQHALLSCSGQIVGTPAYMAPEQYSGDLERCGPACDVWALGVVLYEVLTGQRPFQGSSTKALRKAVLTRDPVPPRSLNRRLDPGLEAVVLKCLEKDPSRRFASAGELAEELGRWLRGEPLRTRPPTKWQRLLRWSRRYAFSLAIALFLTGVTALLASLHLSRSPLGTNSDIESSQELLHRTGRVELVGTEGLPRAYRMPWARAGVAVADSGHFEVHAQGLCMLELLPGPMPDRFVFSAKVQQTSAQFMGTIGLYAGRVKLPDGTHYALSFEFSDLGKHSMVLKQHPLASEQGHWATLQTIYLPGIRQPPFHILYWTHHYHLPPNPWNPPGPWRQLQMQLADDTFRVYLDGFLASEITRQELREKMSDWWSNQYMEVAGWSRPKEMIDMWPTQGGLGVLINKSTALVAEAFAEITSAPAAP